MPKTELTTVHLHL